MANILQGEGTRVLSEIDMFPRGFILMLLEDAVPPGGYHHWYLTGVRKAYAKVDEAGNIICERDYSVSPHFYDGKPPGSKEVYVYYYTKI